MLQQNPVPEADQLKFSDHWVHDWMAEFGVSLEKPHKRFSVSQKDRKQRILDLLKYMIRIRHFFMKKHNVSR